jgi:uncharacterized membrane protein YjjP (DUF1212 family)
MTPLIQLGTGLLCGVGAIAILDRHYKPSNYTESLLTTISAIACSSIGLFWGGFAAGTALTGGILATLLTVHDTNNITTKIAVRIAFIILFGGIGLGFQRAFV